MRQAKALVGRAAWSLTASSIVVLASFAGPLQHASAGPDVIVEMRLMHFTPEKVQARTGSTVVFYNADTFDYPALSGKHRVVADNGAFDTGMIAPGARASRTFLEPISTSFYCTIHPTLMMGTLEVTGKPVQPVVTDKEVDIVEPDAGNPDTWGYDPAALSLQVGGKVTWRNNGAVAHTVTAADGSFDETLEPGEKKTIAFPKATAIRYACTPHPWMKGTLKVGAAALPPPDPPKKTTSEGPAPGMVPIPRSGTGPMTFNVAAVEPDEADPMGWGFAPPTLTARENDTIVWRNDGAQPHTVTAADGSFDQNLEPGQTFRYTLGSTGTLQYSCKPHPWMKGTVQVIAAGAAPGSVAPPSAPDASPPEQPDVAETADEERGVVIDPLRVKYAVGTGAAIMLFVAAIILTGRRRVVTLPPPDVEQVHERLELESEERVPVGAGV